VADCFLSYARAVLDQTALSQIQSALKSADISYWFDGHLISKEGTLLNEEIAREILTAQVIVVFASAQYFSSRYCQAEAAYASQVDKNIIRIEVEPYEMPPSALPLSSLPFIKWHSISWHEFLVSFVTALARFGIDASKSLISPEVSQYYSIIDQADAALVRPNYFVLKSSHADALRDCERRLTDAQRANPGNGYNYLSLSYISLYRGDSARALDLARRAVNIIGSLPDSHFAEALALCAMRNPLRRSRDDVEEILRRLAIARRLPKSGAHIDLLSAIVIANYYLPNYLTPPALPEELLKRGLSSQVPFNKSEVSRVLECETPLNPKLLPSLSLYFDRSQMSLS